MATEQWLNAPGGRACVTRHILLLDYRMAKSNEEHTLIPPKPIQEALDADPAVRAAWEKLPYSHQREWAKAVDDAKKDETKQRRVDQMVEKLLS